MRRYLASHPVGSVLGLILVSAFLLRLWGIKHGLPFVYNIDERSNFVPHAIGMFGHSFNPGYFVNPPGYTYLLYVVFAVFFGGKSGVGHAYATDPTAVFIVARLCSAVLGVVAVWLIFETGKRLFDDVRKGLVAAALLAFSFLPVFYSHLGVNDVPTLVLLTAALLGVAGILRYGRRGDYLLAGAALGVACATKYTAGIVLIPLLCAIVFRLRDGGEVRQEILKNALFAAVLIVVGFLLFNPFALLDFDTFWDGIAHQSSASGDGAGKLGITQKNGFLYYLWALTWGYGWLPLTSAFCGALALIKRERRLAVLLIPAPLIFILFMGMQDRYFGRWILPIFPILCLLSAYFTVVVAEWIAQRTKLTRRSVVLGLTVLMLAQGIVYCVHNDLVLSRGDTRQMTREWMIRNLPVGTKIAIEPVVPDQWIENDEVGSDGRLNRWTKLRTSRSIVNNDGSLRRGGVGRAVTIEDYEFTTRPQLIDSYRRGGFCWVVSGSTQSQRALINPELVPRAIQYYDRLAKEAKVVYRASPYRAGAGPVEFNFDWSFDYYPLAYYRPGPVMTIYRLSGGKCS